MQAPPCPRCRETRLTEIVRTKQTREAFCNVCSFAWSYEATLCRCRAVPIEHFHASTRPLCPRCGKPARESRPADV